MKTLEEIRRLSPEQRIKRLKELEKQRKKEIEEAAKLLKESEIEIKERERLSREIPIPQVTAVDINHLFTREEKEIFVAKRFEIPKVKEEEQTNKEKTLEETVSSEDIKPLSHSQEVQYRIELKSHEPMNILYNEVKSLYQEIKSAGSATDAQIKRIEYLSEAIQRKQQDINLGEYKSIRQDVQEKMGISMSWIKYMRRMR